MNTINNKFQNPYLTAKGEPRAVVPFNQLDTLWFNTGTKCNLSCKNCYMESSPKNNRLEYLSIDDIIPYLVEIAEKQMPTSTIGLTGGEPFLNPDIINIISEILGKKLNLLILTNAFQAIRNHQSSLLSFRKVYENKLKLRISLDHYTKELHEKERGPGTFDETIKMGKWLCDNNFNISIAGRSLTHEKASEVLTKYQKLLNLNNINLDLILGENLVIFPEMSDNQDVPEITTKCWDILGKKPDDQKCSTSRMVIKREGEKVPTIVPCTLLVYDRQFELGTFLNESGKEIPLNHRYCAQFCVLGGSCCS